VTDGVFSFSELVSGKRKFVRSRGETGILQPHFDRYIRQKRKWCVCVRLESGRRARICDWDLGIEGRF